jgi:hypothetical protein
MDTVSPPDEMAFELAVLEDVSRQADVFWRNWLWRRRQPGFGPSLELLEKLAPRYGTGGVEEAWRRWFDVLTSWEYADAVVGRDVRHLLFAVERQVNRGGLH